MLLQEFRSRPESTLLPSKCSSIRGTFAGGIEIGGVVPIVRTGRGLERSARSGRGVQAAQVLPRIPSFSILHHFAGTERAEPRSVARVTLLSRLSWRRDAVYRAHPHTILRCGTPCEHSCTHARHVMLPDLIRHLSSPSAYPHLPRTVTVSHTHASVLFFAGDLVYKVKKPVSLGFLDFSTLERRRHFCEEEVRLNRRLAPEMYLGVAPITRDAAGRVCVRGEGEAVEYAVEMRRLPADLMLDHLLDSGAAGKPEIDRIAGTLAVFHARAATGPGVDEHGTPAAVAVHLDRNLAQVRAVAGDVPDRPRADSPVVSCRALDHLGAWSRRFRADHRELLQSRVTQGRIRDGHGDLHAGNICMCEPGGMPVIYDCIEFDAALRSCDVASDVAFLGMDLDMRRRRDLSAHLVRVYQSLSGDSSVAALQPLYRSHFAMVRAKVSAIRARDQSLPGEERLAAWRMACRYANLAVGYALPACLIIMTGLPGSGKSWMAREVEAPLGITIVRADEVRKTLAGLSPGDRPVGAARDELYSPAMTDRTYAALLERARDELTAGRGIIVDATYPTIERRAAVMALAGSLNAPWVVVHSTATEGIIRQRLQARAAEASEPSDADFAVYLRARDAYQPPAEVPARHRVEAPADALSEVVISRVLDALLGQ